MPLNCNTKECGYDAGDCGTKDIIKNLLGFVIKHKESSFNLPKDTKLPPNQFNEYNKLYPEENNSFRVVGKEKITTSAGTFNCTIVEVIEGFDKKLKLWMINDKPYIFAKMIKERTDKMYGYYHMYELQEIK